MRYNKATMFYSYECDFYAIAYLCSNKTLNFDFDFFFIMGLVEVFCSLKVVLNFICNVLDIFFFEVN